MLKEWIPGRFMRKVVIGSLAITCFSSVLATSPVETAPQVPGLYQAVEVDQRLTVLPVPGVVFGVFVEDLDDNGLADVVLLHRSGEYMQSFMQQVPGEFVAGEKLEGMGFHPNAAMRVPGERALYLVNAEGARALITVEASNDGSLSEVSRSENPPSVVSVPVQWPEYGLSLAVSRYESGVVDLLVGYDPVANDEQAYFEIALSIHDVAGEAAVVDLTGSGVPEFIVPLRRDRSLWAIAAPEGDEAPVPEKVWRFDEGAPRMVAVRQTAGGVPLLLVPLDGARKIALLKVEDDGLRQAGELAFPPRFGPGRIKMATDRDGAVLIAADSENQLVVYRIEAGGELDEVRAYQFSMGVGAQYFGFHDLDGDGYLDLVMGLRKREDSLVAVHGPLKGLQGDLGQGITVEPVAIEPQSGTPLAWVGSRPLTNERLSALMVTGGAGHLLQTPAGRQRALRLALDEWLLDEAAYRAGVDRAQIERDHFPRPPEPDESTLRAHYDEAFEEFGIPERVHLIQIQFRIDDDEDAAKERALGALARLEAGEAFEAVAAELTESPRARERGGNVGFVSRNVEPWLRDALEGLEPGQYSGIVRSPAGFELLKIVDQRDPLVPPFEEVVQQVSNSWRSKRQIEVRERFIAELEERIGVVFKTSVAE